MSKQFEIGARVIPIKFADWKPRVPFGTVIDRCGCGKHCHVLVEGTDGLELITEWADDELSRVLDA